MHPRATPFLPCSLRSRSRTRHSLVYLLAHKRLLLSVNRSWNNNASLETRLRLWTAISSPFGLPGLSLGCFETRTRPLKTCPTMHKTANGGSGLGQDCQMGPRDSAREQLEACYDGAFAFLRDNGAADLKASKPHSTTAHAAQLAEHANRQGSVETVALPCHAIGLEIE